MHAAALRLGIQGTILSEYEVFGNCCHFYTFDIFPN